MEDLYGSRGLTPRQKQVVALVAQGWGNKEIANKLGLKHGTVKVYMERILDKLGMSNRTEVAVWATK
jgi:two-component system, NarL family, nitrate/nitrite response regulator NarL